MFILAFKSDICWHQVYYFSENQLITVCQEYGYIWGLSAVWGLATIWEPVSPPAPEWNRHALMWEPVSPPGPEWNHHALMWEPVSPPGPEWNRHALMWEPVSPPGPEWNHHALIASLQSTGCSMLMIAAWSSAIYVSSHIDQVDSR